MFGSGVEWPVSRAEVTSEDPNEAHRWLQRNFSGYRVATSVRQENFRFRATQADLGRYTVSRIRFPMAAELVVPPMGIVLVAQVFDGGYGFSNPHKGVWARRGEIVLVPYHDEIRVAWTKLDIGALTLKPDDVARIAAETTGIDPARLRFTGGLPVSAGADRHWRGAIGYVNRMILPNPVAAGSALIQAEAGRLLAVALLATFENNSMTFEAAAGTGATTPAAFRRAVAYIDDNARSEVTITQIASAARVGARAIQTAFRRHLDTTPLAYLRQVRLAGAHRELLAGDPNDGDTVAGVAANWGFGQAGRFSTSYRETYARSPSETLRS